MRIGLQTWGSEGDVRPFVALSAGLAAHGHDVTLYYTSVDRRDFTAAARAGGFRAVPVASAYFVSHREEVERELARLLRVRDPLKQLRGITDLLFDPVLDEMYAAACEMCRSSDAVVLHFLHFAATAAVLRHKIPFVELFTAPVIASRHVVPTGMPNLGRWLNPLLWRIANWAVDSIYVPRVNRLFTREGLPPLKSVVRDGVALPLVNLVAVSPSLFPRPPDWHARNQVVGFLSLPPAVDPWEAPAELSAFLEAGPPPVYMTFGSMMGLDPGNARDSVALLAEAARLADTRAVIQVPEGLLGEVSRDPRILALARASHDKVFPRCALVVHHGGAGTTQSATTAGRPSVIVAHATDQFFWGETLHQRGLSPRHLARRSATGPRLAQRIREALGSPSMTTTALELGARMGAEDGVARAVLLIEEGLGRGGETADALLTRRS